MVRKKASAPYISIFFCTSSPITIFYKIFHFLSDTLIDQVIINRSMAMSINALHKHTLPKDDQLVSCELCLESVPLSESEISEAQDYVAYFCGLECYDVWKNQKVEKDKS